GMYTMGFDRLAPMVRALREYTVAPIVEQVSCPTLVLDAQDDHFFDQQAQAQRVYDALRCPKALATFTAEEGAEEHCQVGAMGLHTQRVFDWLEELPAFAEGPAERVAAAV